MPGQGIWSGTISFSLVAIPVRLVKAVEPGRVTFRLLHGKDHAPLARGMYCPDHDAMVPPDEFVKGYELAPGHYLPITGEELESVSPGRSRTIEVMEFIDVGELDPVYFDHPYYLAPLKGGEKSYRLLAEAMRKTQKAGIAKFVLAEREHLVAVISKDGALALITLHYGEEVLSDRDFGSPKGEISSALLGKIKRDMQSMLTDFDPLKYSDSRKIKLLELVKGKAAVRVVEAPVKEEDEGEGPPDLMAVLEEAMRQAGKNE